MKYYSLNLLVEVPNHLSIDDLEYEFRMVIEANDWSASGKIIEVDENDDPIEGKEIIVTAI